MIAKTLIRSILKFTGIDKIKKREIYVYDSISQFLV